MRALLLPRDPRRYAYACAALCMGAVCFPGPAAGEEWDCTAPSPSSSGTFTCTADCTMTSAGVTLTGNLTIAGDSAITTIAAQTSGARRHFHVASGDRHI